MSLERVGIKDGTGNGFLAKVNSAKQLHTRSVQISALHDAALRGDAFAWNGVSAAIATTDCIILVANTSSSRLLVIDHAYIRGDIASQIKVKLSDVTGLTLAGTAVTGVNLNRTSAKIADASAWVDETASAATTIILTHYQHLAVNGQVTTSPMARLDFAGSIVLGEDAAFGMDLVIAAGLGAFEATVVGYFIDA